MIHSTKTTRSVKVRSVGAVWVLRGPGLADQGVRRIEPHPYRKTWVRWDGTVSPIVVYRSLRTMRASRTVVIQVCEMRERTVWWRWSCKCVRTCEDQELSDDDCVAASTKTTGTHTTTARFAECVTERQWLSSDWASAHTNAGGLRSPQHVLVTNECSKQPQTAVYLHSTANKSRRGTNRTHQLCAFELSGRTGRNR